MSLPTTGYLVDSSGNVVAHVHGFTGAVPDGQTFVSDPAPSIAVGQAAPVSFAAAVAATDGLMPRNAEDLIVALVTKGLIAWTDLPAQVHTHINSRRAFRGQTEV